jgi:hypothetical protein
MDISTLPTIVYISAAISIILAVFYLVATVLIIFLLQDIRMELRALNDNTNNKS